MLVVCSKCKKPTPRAESYKPSRKLGVSHKMLCPTCYESIRIWRAVRNLDMNFKPLKEEQ